MLTDKHQGSAELQRTASGRLVEAVIKMFMESKEHRMSRSERGNLKMLAAEYSAEMGGTDTSRLSGMSGDCCAEGSLEEDKCGNCKA